MLPANYYCKWNNFLCERILLALIMQSKIYYYSYPACFSRTKLNEKRLMLNQIVTRKLVKTIAHYFNAKHLLITIACTNVFFFIVACIDNNSKIQFKKKTEKIYSLCSEKSTSKHKQLLKCVLSLLLSAPPNNQYYSTKHLQCSIDNKVGFMLTIAIYSLLYPISTQLSNP